PPGSGCIPSSYRGYSSGVRRSMFSKEPSFISNDTRVSSASAGALLRRRAKIKDCRVAQAGRIEFPGSSAKTFQNLVWKIVLRAVFYRFHGRNVSLIKLTQPKLVFIRVTIIGGHAQAGL